MDSVAVVSAARFLAYIVYRGNSIIFLSRGCPRIDLLSVVASFVYHGCIGINLAPP